MKLASYRDGSRDGQLIVVSRDLSLAHYASGIAGRLQQVLDDWNFLSPQLEELSQTLNHGKARHAFAFEPAKCLAPLPRAFQHAAIHGDADGAVPVQLSGDALLGPHDALAAATADNDTDDGNEAPIDSVAGFAAITGDIASGTAPDVALEGIRLLMLASDAAGTQAFGPVAVTPDELGAAWHDGQVHLRLDATHDGRRAAPINTGDAGHAHFGRLISALARARAVRAGSIVAWCTAGGPVRERLRLEAKGEDGLSVFGAIDRRLPAPVETADGV